MKKRKINAILAIGLSLTMMAGVAGCGKEQRLAAEIDPDTPVSEVQFPLKESAELSFITSAPATSTPVSYTHLDGGEIKIMGKTPEQLGEKEKEELGVVLAEAGFSGYLKGKDVEAVLARLYPRFEAEKFHLMCDRYQIPLNKFIKEYSTGTKAKLNLIIALTCLLYTSRCV